MRHPRRFLPCLSRPTTAVLALMAFVVLAGCATTAPERLASSATAPAPRPNIVVILADDMGYSDVGSYGGEIRTPNLDRLAAGGLRFTSFYNTARCSPTRASLLTGLYAHQAGVGRLHTPRERELPEPGPYQGYLSENAVTIAEVLRDAGYRTYMSGKWHVGARRPHWPRQRGFDRFFGFLDGANSYFELFSQHLMALDDETWQPSDSGFYMTDAFTDYAVRFVEEHAEGHADIPFFLYVAYTAPHWPLHAPEEDVARYRGVYDGGWDSLRAARFDRMKALGVADASWTLPPRPGALPAWSEVEDRAEWSRRMEVHAAMVDRMDRGIGQIVSALERNGMLQNTLILFLSDNGAAEEHLRNRPYDDPAVPVGRRGSYRAFEEPWAYASNTPFRFYKKWLHEGGIATPLIAYWPAGIAAPGSMTRQTGHVIDVMATSVDLAGASYPARRNDREIQPLEGLSLAPILRGQGRDGHEYLFWEHYGARAVRKGDWKLVMEADETDWHLYDLSVDPTEADDVAARRPALVRELSDRWDAWAARVRVFPHPQ